MKLLLALLLAAASGKHEWLGSEMPLPLAVRTPQDLEFKSVAEREYLIFNLLTSGKVAWDAGDFATAAAKWESLLAVPDLEPSIDKVVRPFAQEARRKAGGKAGDVPPPPAPRVSREESAPAPSPRKREVTSVLVEGTVSGGGAAGPGGAVVSLRRTDGPMPKPLPARKVVLQRGKAFVPRVLAIGEGSSVVFRNEDPINHNVFSLAPHFDTGLYGAGGEKEQVFDKAGVVQLLCNIHSSMIGYVVVVDTPWFAQADATGAFSIKGVAPGEYDVEAWHEYASQPTRQKLTVGRDGAKLALTVAGDKQPPQFPPDKYGKPRQQQLGY
jgi:plastocyanin